MRSDRVIRLIVPHALAIKEQALEKRGHEVAEEETLLAPAEPKDDARGAGGLEKPGFQFRHAGANGCSIVLQFGQPLAEMWRLCDARDREDRRMTPRPCRARLSRALPA